ncbi:MAG: lipocalin family protein [Spirochaetales bacterium]|nr:lipocalin family protein [Spirochaetales bacterium]
MKKQQPIRHAVSALALAAFALVALAGCELFGLGKDPIEGTWDLVAICDTGTRSTLTELGAPEGYSEVLEFGDGTFVYTMTNPESYSDPVSFSGTWELSGEIYVLASNEDPTDPIQVWLVGDELRMNDTKNELDYLIFNKR